MQLSTNGLTSPDSVRALIGMLDQEGTFHFPRLQNGLFCASSATHSDIAETGYQNVWIRDNVHVAHAHLVLGDAFAASRNASAIMRFFTRHQSRLDRLLDGSLDPTPAANRPHVRFNGATLDELPEQWAHAQNDALGYFLWLYCKLVRQEHLHFCPPHREVIASLVHFLELIEYWQDEDSGHWEETRKIEASSIGTVVAGLQELDQVLGLTGEEQAFAELVHPIDRQQVQSLLERGREALQEILPWECRQPPPLEREADAALLFLIYPLRVVDDATADAILENVRTHLQAEHGIRRYLGDSYWCADYKKLLAANIRTSDFSEDTSTRDALLKDGEEAQWCLFDPIVSIIYGERYQEGGDRADFDRQRAALDRALSQVTDEQCRFGPFLCPESYYLENGRWVPNDICPLLWTQANLRLALDCFERSLAMRADS